jgi:hypothetical protein
MRKVFALLLVGGMFTFASCGEKKSVETETTQETMSSEGTVSSDSTGSVSSDSTGAMGGEHMDSTHTETHVDSAAKM